MLETPSEEMISLEDRKAQSSTLKFHTPTLSNVNLA
jgi:hypothetical protein